MFGIFFISVPLLSITYFHKKLKSINPQSGLNSQEQKFENQIEIMKFLHSPSIIMCERMNIAHLHSVKPTPFRFILN
jgi:hypothetical protein